jgi:hypothetical protein
MSTGRSEAAGSAADGVVWCGGGPRRDAGEGGSHGQSAQAASSEPGDPPYDARGRDSSHLSRATRLDNFR